MKSEKMKTHFEVFVCNHKRDGGEEDCASKGSKDLTDQLKKWAKENHSKDLKVYRSGCLSKCSEGIAMACYPQKELLLEVRPDDSHRIKQDLEEAIRKSKD